MKNLKKTLAVVLAFAMVLSMGFSAFAYTDVAEGTKVAEAVGILSNLGIFTGFEDGTFKPNDTVTRAQMAAIICRTLGYEDQAAASTGTTNFYDVPASHWASGYVNVAESLQIVNGYGNGAFGPEDQVTYEQAIKMIVVALGYELDAQAKGGWSTGYLAVASREGISKNSNGVVGTPATRGTIAVLVYNSLEVRLMDQDSWTNDGKGDSFRKLSETILSRYLEVDKWEGVVSITPLTDAAANGYKKDAAPLFNLTDDAKWVFEGIGNSVVYKLDDSQSLTVSADASLVEDVNKFLGKKVVAYIGREVDSTTGNRMVYAVAEKQGLNDSIVINATQLVATDATENKIAYRNPGSTKVLDVTLNASIAGYTNFSTLANTAIKQAGVGTSDDTKITTEDFAALLPNGGSIELIDSNPAVAGYDTVIVTKYDLETVVEAVETDRGVVKFETNDATSTLARFDTEAENQHVIVYKDGQVASVEDIAAGDTVTVAKVRNDNSVRVFYVSSKTVTGAVEGWNDAKNEVTIGGEDYNPSKTSTYYQNIAATLKGKEGVFYLNVDGQIVLADASASKGNYGLILNVGKASMGKYAVEIALADGTVASYDLASTLTLGATSGKTALEVATAIADIMDDTTAPDPDDETSEGGSNGPLQAPGLTYSADEAYAHTDTAAQLLCEFKVKEGAIKNLRLISAGSVTQNKYSEETMTIGSKSFDESTVMFALAEAHDATGKIEAEDVQVGKAVELLADEEEYYTAATEYENKVYGLALGYDLVASIPVDSDAVIVTDKSSIAYDDDVAVRISGIQAGAEVSFILYNDNGFDSASSTELTNLEVGDVILVSAANAEGVVADFQVIYDRSTGTTASDIAAKDVNYHVSMVDETKAASSDFIWLSTADTAPVGQTSITTADSGSNYVLMQRAANYTLVDFTEDAANPEIYEVSANKSLVGDIGTSGTESSKVFLRVVDEKLVEVVVYRTKD